MFSNSGVDSDERIPVGVVGGVLVGGGSRGVSLVISKQLPILICVHLDKRIPAIIPITADAHAPMMSVRSVALYSIDGGGVYIGVDIWALLIPCVYAF